MKWCEVAEGKQQNGWEALSSPSRDVGMFKPNGGRSRGGAERKRLDHSTNGRAALLWNEVKADDRGWIEIASKQ